MGIAGSSYSDEPTPPRTWQVYETFSGATDAVTCLALSDDGMWLYTGSRDGLVRKYDTGMGQEVATWSHGALGDPVEVMGVAVSEDYVYSAGEDGAVCQFHAASGVIIRRLHEHRRPCTCLVAAPGGILFTGGDRPGLVRWDIGQILPGDAGSAVHDPSAKFKRRGCAAVAGAKFEEPRGQREWAPLPEGAMKKSPTDGPVQSVCLTPDAAFVLVGIAKPVSWQAAFGDELQTFANMYDGAWT